MDYEKCAEQFMESVLDIQATRSLDGISRFSKGETRLLTTLHYSGGSMQAKELAGMAGISTARVTAILNAEEEKGYIRREAIDGDRRKINVILTQAGEMEYQNRRQRLHDLITSFLVFLGEADTGHLLHVMNRTKEFVETKRKENQG